MVTTITLNASIDKAYYIEGPAENGTVMRVKECINTAGGKGLNVARAAMRAGSKVSATGFAGGFNGQYLQSMLKKDGVDSAFVEIEGETRSCINILDTKYGSTEYLEPGCEVSAEEVKKFMDKLPEIVEKSDVVAVSGSVPKGVDKGIYGEIVAACKKAGKKIIVDTSGELLVKSIDSCPTMIKPNKDEMEFLLDRKISGMEEVVAAAKELHSKGIEYVAVSLGGDGALLVSDEGVIHGKPPKMEVVNTVGCGDSMVGAFAVAMENKMSAEEMLRFAISVASSNAMSQATGDVNMDLAEKIKPQVTIAHL